MKVVCINDTKLPPGAELTEGKEYVVKQKFVNSYDQVVYIIDGVPNNGRTKMGLPWIGYLSTRFAVLDSKSMAEEAVEHLVLN